MNTEHYTLIAYAIYLTGVTATTLAVAGMIFRHGKVFIAQGYAGDEAAAGAAGGMLRTQFNLTALAAMLLLLRFSATGDTGFLSAARPDNVAALFEALSVKLGLMLLIIGAMHFFTLRAINRIRTRGEIF